MDNLSKRLIYRNAKYSDWNNLAAVFKKIFPNYPPKKISHTILTHRHRIRICTKDDEILGFYVTYALGDQRHLWLDYIGLVEEARGLGVADALLSDVEKQSETWQFSAISLTVDRDNTAAIKLYERAGYICDNRSSSLLEYTKELINTRLANNTSTSKYQNRSESAITKLFWRIVYRIIVFD